MDKNMITTIKAINKCSEMYIGNKKSLLLANNIAKPGSNTTITDNNKKKIFNILQARVSKELLKSYKNDIITIIEKHDIRISKEMLYEGHERIPGIIQYFFTREAELKNRYEAQKQIIRQKTGYELPAWEKLFIRNYIIALRKQLFEICSTKEATSDASSHASTGKQRKNTKLDGEEATSNGIKKNVKKVTQSTERKYNSQSPISYIKEGVILRYTPKGSENILSFLHLELDRPLSIIDNGIIKPNGAPAKGRIFQILDIMKRNESLIQEKNISNLRNTLKQLSLSPGSYRDVKVHNELYKNAIQQLLEEIRKQAESESGEEISTGPTPYEQKLAEIKERFNKTNFRHRKR